MKIEFKGGAGRWAVLMLGQMKLNDFAMGYLFGR